MSRTHDELTEMIPHILYVFTQSVACFVWRYDHGGIATPWPPSNYKEEMAANACLESSLMSMRTLNEFFRDHSPKHKPRPDDVRAFQYPGYVTLGSFLTKDDEDEIHKRLAHLSTRRLAATPGWQLKMLWDPSSERMIHFLEYLRRDFVPMMHPLFPRVVKLRESLREITPNAGIFIPENRSS